MPSHSKPDSSPRLLIAGFGDLGRRLVPLISDQWLTYALSRSPKQASSQHSSLSYVQADLSRPETLASVQGRWDAVIYTATPSERSPEGYRKSYVEGLQNLLNVIDTDRLIFVSSTAVYGQDQGEWVDESSDTQPTQFNGQILLEAEQIAHQAGGMVVRFSGIYGPGRSRLIERVRSGPLTCRREPPIWTNRIHSEDCAAVLAHLIKLESPQKLYLASDHEPVPRWDVYSWLAKQLNAQAPEERVDSTEGQGKRVSNERLTASGFEFRYRNFRDGFGDGYQGLI